MTIFEKALRRLLTVRCCKDCPGNYAIDQGTIDAIVQAHEREVLSSYKAGGGQLGITAAQIHQARQEGFGEGVGSAFDWIWKRWNFDLSKMDRAKEHFKSSKHRLNSGYLRMKGNAEDKGVTTVGSTESFPAIAAQVEIDEKGTEYITFKGNKLTKQSAGVYAGKVKTK